MASRARIGVGAAIAIAGSAVVLLIRESDRDLGHERCERRWDPECGIPIGWEVDGEWISGLALRSFALHQRTWGCASCEGACAEWCESSED